MRICPIKLFLEAGTECSGVVRQEIKVEQCERSIVIQAEVCLDGFVGGLDKAKSCRPHRVS